MEAGDSPATIPPPSRPALLPAARWARAVLVLLLAFTLLRGFLWGASFPDFYGPDEDYHFLYVEYLTTQHALIDPKRPLYPAEYERARAAIQYRSYGVYPRASFRGPSKASVRALGRLPESAREPRFGGRGIRNVHPPLYHLGGALVNGALGNASILTRVAAVRWYTAFWGVASVYLAWLLAAQVLARERPRLLAAFLVAVQPMVATLSGVVNHDQALIATFTAALAMMAFLLRTPPRAAQGAWLGGAIALALLVKSTALVLVPLAALAYAGQALAFRGARRVVMRSAALAAGLPLALAGWWYVRSEIVYGSITGYAKDPVPPGRFSASPGRLLEWSWDWVSRTYRTYWWHHFRYEAPRLSIVFRMPQVAGVLGAAGLVRMGIAERRRLLAREDPLLRQCVLLLSAALAVWLPVMATDLARRAHGAPFNLAGGRYLLPAFPAVAVLFVVGLRALVGRRLESVAMAAVALGAAAFCWKAWTLNYAFRYFGVGPPHHPLGLPPGGWHELFRRMSFDRPELVTPTSLTVALLLALAALAGAAVVAVVGERRTRELQQ